MGCDFKELIALRDRLSKADMDKVIEGTVNEVAQRVVSRAKHFTPYKTGNLRRNWVASKAVRSGIVYYSKVYNDTPYAEYVNSGHRTPNHKGWVKGFFMLEKSTANLDNQVGKALQHNVEKVLKEAMG